MKNVWLSVTSLAFVLGCGSAPAPVSKAPEKTVLVQPAKPEPAPVEATQEATKDDESSRMIARMLDKVARVRGLPIKRPVPGKVLDRDALGQYIREKVDEGTPREVLVAQGEMLTALELVPPEYDFCKGPWPFWGGALRGFTIRNKL